MAELDLSDRQTRWILIPRRNISIEKAKNAEVNIGGFNVLEAPIDRTLIRRSIVFHCIDLVAALEQRFVNNTAILFKVFVRRGKVDGRHVTALKQASGEFAELSGRAL